MLSKSDNETRYRNPISDSVYSMVKRNPQCVDCEQEIFSDDWEPITLEINGEKIHAAHCHACIHHVYTVRMERIAEEASLLAILADGREIIAVDVNGEDVNRSGAMRMLKHAPLSCP